MLAVKSKYSAEIEDKMQLGGRSAFFKGKFSGVVANHLGSGIWGTGFISLQKFAGLSGPLMGYPLP